MGRKKSKAKRDVQAWETPNASGHFTRLFDDLLNSEAFKRLSAQAKLVYILMRQEYKGEGYTGNKVKCPYSKIETYRIGRKSISKGIQELIEAGFIEIVEQGGLYHRPSVYKFSSRWYTEKK